MNRKYIVGVCLAAALTLAGCSGDDRPAVDETPPATSSAAPTEPQPSPKESSSQPVTPPAKETACPDRGWNTAEDWSSESPQTVTNELFDVRPGRHECFDRVVFDVATTKDVDFFAKYVETVGHEGSGNPVEVDGNAALQVTVYAPSPELLAGFGFTADWPALREIRFAGTFEGMSTFALGVSEKQPFAVYLQHDGDVTKVVVDIAH